MIIEITGLPGAGKTTCERCLAEALSRRGYQVLTDDDVVRGYVRDHVYAAMKLSYGLRRLLPIRALAWLGYRAAVACRHWRRCGAISAVSAALVKAKRLRCLGLSQSALLADYYQNELAPSRQENTAYMTSGGVTHSLAMVKVWSGRRCSALAGGWIEAPSPADTLVIHLQAPLAMALERLERRGLPPSWPRKMRGNRDLVSQTLLRFEEAIHQTLRQRQEAGIRVMTLENSSDLTSLAASVAALAESLPDAPAAAPGPAAPAGPACLCAPDSRSAEAPGTRSDG